MSESINNPYGSSASDATAGNYSVTGIRPMRLKRIDPLSCGMMLGALYVFIGLFVSVFMIVIALIGIAGAGGMNGAGVFGGVIGAIFVPVMYGVLGFIGGLIMALLYNLCSSVIGGIEMHFE